MKRLLLCALAALLWPSSSSADPCAGGTALPDGPVPVGLLDGQLGVARRACPRTELGLAAGGRAIIELESFYGNLQGGLTLHGSWALDERTELFGAFEAVRYDTVIASLSASRLGIGFLSVGATRRLWSAESSTVGATARLRLPTAVGLYRNTVPLGADVGALAQHRLGSSVDLHGQLGLLTDVGLGPGPAAPRLGVGLTAGGSWRATSWLALTGELGLGMGYAAALDVLALGLGVRFGGERLGGELALRLPLAGRERALAGFSLGLQWRF